MKFLSILAVLGVACASPQEYYEIDLSTTDIEGFLKNPEKMKMYADCLLDLGECTPIGEAVKKELPRALETSCAKCSPDQKKVIRKILVTARDQLPEKTEQLIKKYDPEGQYREKIAKFLASTD